MNLEISDWIGFSGVAMLLIAFLLNLWGSLERNSLSYILLNLIGAGLACLASSMIGYMPFVILEGTWTMVSLLALINLARKKIS